MNGINKQNSGKKPLFLLLVCVLTANLAGCGAGGRTDHQPSAQGPSTSGPSKAASDRAQLRMLVNGQTLIPFETRNGTQYADVGRMADATGFHKEWLEDGRFVIGDHDVVWSFKPESRTAVKEEQSLSMEAPAIKNHSGLLIPVSMLKPLFNDEAVFAVEADQASIFPYPGNKDPAAAAGAPAFGDDPLDPGLKPAPGDAAAAWFQVGSNKAPAAANRTGLAAMARKFKGVPYSFGTGSFNVTKRFDCSSFVQYVYRNVFHIPLPRTARAQAIHGVSVSRSKLRAGDLLFFYVPGRFKSDTKVGHVGIYMGGQKNDTFQSISPQWRSDYAD